MTLNNTIIYHIFPIYLDRYDGAKSVNPDQTAPEGAV